MPASHSNEWTCKTLLVIVFPLFYLPRSPVVGRMTAALSQGGKIFTLSSSDKERKICYVFFFSYHKSGIFKWILAQEVKDILEVCSYLTSLALLKQTMVQLICWCGHLKKCEVCHWTQQASTFKLCCSSSEIWTRHEPNAH